MKTLGNIFNFSRTEKGTKTAAKTNQYQCPMKCEGYKLYDAPGNCPVCNMKLVPVSVNGSKHHEHGHSDHACC